MVPGEPDERLADVSHAPAADHRQAAPPQDDSRRAHLPFSLKYTLDGAALALRRTRRDASAKTLLSALIWRHVNPTDVGALIELLAEYYDVARRPLPLAQGAAGPT